MNGSPPQLNQRAVKKHHTQLPLNNLPLPIKSLHSGLVIAGRFKLVEKIGQGSFGSIFKTENLETSDVCATKFEKREDASGGISLLVREIKVLMEVKGVYGFPQISFYGRDEHFNYFMINYLGYNFESLIRKCGGKFTVLCSLQIAVQMLSRIEIFHTKNLIHRDIKPENFVIGNNDVSVVHLIDFGLSKYYKDTNGKHIPFIDKKGIIGTARYASVNAHQGNEQSRRDDLEGIGYVLIYFAKGKLPWMNIQTEGKTEKYNKIMEMKVQTTNEVLCEGLPKCFLNYFQYIKTIQFSEQPNYGYIKGLFQNAIQEQEKTEKFTLYDWEKLPEFKIKRGASKQKDQSTNFNFQIDQPKKLQEPPKNDKLEEAKKPDRKNQPKKQTLLSPNDLRQKAPFLKVPQNEESNPNNPQQFQKSIADSRAISIEGSKCNNYELSNLNFPGMVGEEKEQFQAGCLLNPLTIPKRKDVKALTISNPKGAPFIRMATKEKDSKKQFQIVNEAYADFDNIHEFADDDPKLSILSFETKKTIRKITMFAGSP